MIQDIINANRYPIVFIGSGISKRYIKDFPTWSDLLQDYWSRIEEEKKFYTFMRSIKRSSEFENLTEADKEFKANTRVAAIIQERFDNLFFEEKIKIEGLSIKTAYEKHISPFKFDLSSKFKTYVQKNEMTEEIQTFTTFLSKAKVIVTTNYDPFIENLLTNIGSSPSIYIGQKGFFDQTNDWAELYKIHGDVTDSESIVITEEDYKSYDNNSILISAKILANMIDSPIVFLGYSLTDRNVRKLLSDFASQLPNEDVRKTTNRIAIVDYKKGEHNLTEEMMRDQILDISYLLISTDNYNHFYKRISEIDEGLSPHEVLRYQKAIKNIVIAAGSKGKLDSVLVSPEQMENLEEQIEHGKNIVVALGNRKNIFVFPDIISYLHDYLFASNELLPSIALSFVAKDGSKLTKTPFVRYLKENDVLSLGLDETIITKINNKIATTSSINDIKKSMSEYYKKEHSSLNEILKVGYNQTKLINVIVYNIQKLDINDLETYIKETAFPLFSHSVKHKTNLKSDLRKLFCAYDILINGEPTKIQ
ncbi:TPA: SIR2 family protein [Listeria monocytogenes]|nr:SIR2 family protein [Listeria monocytogenes]